MELEEQVEKIISTAASRVQWAILLNFYQANRTELSHTEKRKLYLRSEEFRLMYSTEKDFIKREDVSSDIYKDHSHLEANQESSENTLKAVNY